MAKACLYCGTVNDGNARFCMKCGKSMSSGKGSNPSRVKAPQAPGKTSIFCKKCNKQVIVKGKANYYFEPDSPVDYELVEWECYVGSCNHKIRIRKTGRTKDDITGME